MFTWSTLTAHAFFPTHPALAPSSLWGLTSWPVRISLSLEDNLETRTLPPTLTT